MGFIRWLLGLLSGRPATSAEAPTETVEDVADRIDRVGDRCRNAGDTAGADAAREASRRARNARSVEHAWQIERDFLNEHDPKPRAGQRADGQPFVAYGSNARVGGSVAWRNNNPGYIRCDSRLARYNASGCDGEYAIFPDEDAGRVAMVEYFRHEYPGHTVQEALRQQLPPEAGPGAAAAVIEKAGLDPDQKVESLTIDQVETFADTFPDVAGWQLGESLERTADTPADDVWTDDNSTTDAGGEASVTDNS